MVDIQNPELKQLVVHHIYKVPKEELIRNSLTPQGITRPLFWSDGVLFTYWPLPTDADAIVNDYLNGKEHWGEVFWTELPAFSEMLELEDEHIKGVKVRVVDVSTYVPHRDFAKWLKGKKK